jgi:4-hydroxy-3-polyprenylbenzoate decarboxylase
MSHSNDAVSVAITGASGSQYGLRLVEALIAAGRQVYLMLSRAGRIVIPLETGLELPGELPAIADLLARRFGAAAGQLRLFDDEEWTSPAASGSNAPGAMVVVPCSMGTLSAISSGASNILIERAADVMIKERRQLLLVVRETPYSPIHLENMLRLSRLGVVVMPASPGFYNRPQGVDDLVDFMVARILDHLGVDHQLGMRWGAS